MVGRIFCRHTKDVGVARRDHEPDFEACREYLETYLSHVSEGHAGYGKLRLPNMKVNGKGLFSREIYDRLKIICLSSCVDLKVNFLNSLTINGGATGYGMLLAELLRPKRCQCGAVPDADLLRREEKRQVTVGKPNLTMAVLRLI